MPLKDLLKREEYQRDYHRIWYKKNSARRKELVVTNKKRLLNLIQNYKVCNGCADCGYNSHAEALDFDHLRDKKFNIASAPRKGYSWERILIEINKCEVVCANCHRVRTKIRK